MIHPDGGRWIGWATVGRGVLADPLTRLAVLSAWLDPLGGEANDPFLEGVRSVCACFPDLYPDVVAFLHASPPLTDTLEQVVCQHVQAQGIPLDSLDGIGYGIPGSRHAHKRGRGRVCRPVYPSDNAWGIPPSGYGMSHKIG